MHRTTDGGVVIDIYMACLVYIPYLSRRHKPSRASTRLHLPSDVGVIIL
jgi:hypothetical protein